MKEPFKVVDGYVALTAKPGLGIELDDYAVAEKIFTGDWETPALRHPNGSVADW